MGLNERLTVADTAIEKMVAGTEKELARAYAKSLKTIRGQLGEIYAKYAVEGKLTHAEMTKYNRLSVLFKEVDGELKGLTGASSKLTRKLSGDVYEESFFRSAFAVEKEAQVKLGYGLLNPKVIEASVQNPISGLTLNERLIQNRADVIVKLKQDITQGLILGESYPDMARRAKSVLEGNLAKALLVARTEAHRCQQDGRLASFVHAEGKGVPMVKVWNSALDDRTRASHRSMDGQKKKLDEDFVSPSGAKGAAPGQMGSAAEDIRCRCSTRAEIKGYGPSVRRARDAEGKGEIVPYTNYEDWYANRIAK